MRLLDPLRRHPYAAFTFAVVLAVVGDLAVWWQVGSDRPHPFYDAFALTVLVLGYGGLGAFLTKRVPTNDTGVLMLLIAVLAALEAPLAVLALTLAESGSAGVAVAGGLFAFFRLLSLNGALVVMLLLAPTGRPLSRRWAVFVRIWVVVVSLGAVMALLGGPGTDLAGYPVDVDLVPDALNALGWLYIFTNWFSIVGLLAGVICLALRVRRARGVERQQVLWVVVGGLAGPLLTAAVSFVSLAFPQVDSGLVGELLWATATLCLPAGIAVAVTRHGLYDLGRIVSRTFTYAVVTGLVLAIYAVTVTLLTRLVPGSSSFAVAAATLVAAAAFQPLLRRVRRVIDRRFDRAHYDAARIVEEFGDGLRSAVDPDEVTDELLDVLRRTVLPTTATLATFCRRTDLRG